MKPVDFFFRLLNDDPDVTPAGMSRKDFLTKTGRGLAAGVIGTAAVSCNRTVSTGTSSGSATGAVGQTVAGGPVPKLPALSPPATVPAAENKPIELEPIKAKTEQQIPPGMPPLPDSERVGYAIVGLGHLTLDELLPAFGECKKSKVVALVSGSPEKMQKVAKQYGVKPESCYSYENVRQA